jgi:PAS domain S-box-containing protein
MAAMDMTSTRLMADLEKIRDENIQLRERLDRIAEISTAIIYILDMQGHFTFLNKAVHDLLHYLPDELIGKHFSSIMSADEYERVSRMFVLPKLVGKTTGPDYSPKLFDERRTGDRRTRNLEVKLLTKERDGVRILVGDVTGIIAVEGAYDPARIAQGNKSAGFVGSQGIIFDITRYKEEKKERMEFQRRLFESQKMDAIGRLAGGVAHELNNKLVSIIGNTELIKQDFVKENNELGIHVSSILTASRNASELARKLMEFGRSDDTVAKDVNIHTLVDTIAELIRETTPVAVRVTTRFLTPESIVSGSSVRLQSAIMNIATNACNAMALAGGELVFETRKFVADELFCRQHSLEKGPGMYFVLSIQDTGVGMDEGVLKRIFEPFFTTNAVEGGCGLGLASVLDCMKSHCGGITVKSEKNKGSIFELYFPVAKITA